MLILILDLFVCNFETLCDSKTDFWKISQGKEINGRTNYAYVDTARSQLLFQINNESLTQNTCISFDYVTNGRENLLTLGFGNNQFKNWDSETSSDDSDSWKNAKISTYDQFIQNISFTGFITNGNIIAISNLTVNFGSCESQSLRNKRSIHRESLLDDKISKTETSDNKTIDETPENHDATDKFVHNNRIHHPRNLHNNDNNAYFRRIIEPEPYNFGYVDNPTHSTGFYSKNEGDSKNSHIHYDENHVLAFSDQPNNDYNYHNTRSYSEEPIKDTLHHYNHNDRVDHHGIHRLGYHNKGHMSSNLHRYRNNHANHIGSDGHKHIPVSGSDVHFHDHRKYNNHHKNSHDYHVPHVFSHFDYHDHSNHNNGNRHAHSHHNTHHQDIPDYHDHSDHRHGNIHGQVNGNNYHQDIHDYSGHLNHHNGNAHGHRNHNHHDHIHDYHGPHMHNDHDHSEYHNRLNHYDYSNPHDIHPHVHDTNLYNYDQIHDKNHFYPHSSRHVHPYHNSVNYNHPDNFSGYIYEPHQHFGYQGYDSHNDYFHNPSAYRMNNVFYTPQLTHDESFSDTDHYYDNHYNDYNRDMQHYALDHYYDTYDDNLNILHNDWFNHHNNILYDDYNIHNYHNVHNDLLHNHMIDHHNIDHNLMAQRYVQHNHPHIYYKNKYLTKYRNDLLEYQKFIHIPQIHMIDTMPHHHAHRPLYDEEFVVEYNPKKNSVDYLGNYFRESVH
ncbi:hypothetical protein A3Q56_02944 [Intoshia linei]|uniref:MAM domain-containing protein n=1 Tax=Intoshia linei TaxID=1819745 RepID=A0A177B6W9_9BILA|nr:hypothetical protein A3Q56_02944 [Intoshia linei]